MSIIAKEKLIEKEQIKQDEINKENNNIKNNQQKDELKQLSISSTKELIKKLLQNTLNNSILKLETNSTNHISTLEKATESFKNFTNLINNLTKKVEEAKKKKEKEKEKEKKPQGIKKVRKIATEQNLKKRSRTIESNLIKFRSKAVFGIIESSKKNNNILKTNVKTNMAVKKMGNRTLTNFRLNENRIENKSQIISYNTANKLRKNNNIKGPDTSRGSGNVKIREKKMDKTFSQKEKIGLVDSFTNKATSTKRIEYVYEKNNHSKTLILNSLYDIDERKEKYMWNKTKNNNNKNKDIKGIIYKRDKKMAFTNLNNQLDKVNEVNEKKNQVINNNKIIDKNKELKIKAEVADINKLVDLVDSASRGVNRTLSEIHKKEFIKEKNKNLESTDKKQKTNTKILINAIKDVNIKENEENEKDNNNIENKNFNNKSKSFEIVSNKNEQTENTNNTEIINTTNSKDFVEDLSEKDNQLNENKPDKNNNINDENKQKLSTSNIHKINIEFEDINKLKLKKNKSLSSIKLKHNIFIINSNELSSHKSDKSILRNRKSKKENIQEDKKDSNKNSNKIYYQNENIINKSEAIKIIRNKMKENMDKINKKNRNKIKKLNKDIGKDDNKIQNEKINQKNKEEYNNKQIKIIKENIKNINSKNNNLNQNKSEKRLYKFENKMNNTIKRTKSFDNFFK